MIPQSQLAAPGVGCQYHRMNFPPFWAKGSQGAFSCWRCSHSSLEEAAALAKDAARRLADRFVSGDKPTQRYAYGERPLREPVLREFKNSSDEVAAVITRNAYGCLVLNTVRIMFLDVDLPEPKSPGRGWLKKLFGQADSLHVSEGEARALAKAGAWVQIHSDWGWRVYRTRAGLRLLATHSLFDPGAVFSEPVFDELGADPLYRQLCKTQQCFRARLTPKPWRCGAGLPPARWPWPDSKAEASFKKWEGRYLKACGNLATCELIAILGNTKPNPDVQLIISVHDEATRANSKLGLA